MKAIFHRVFFAILALAIALPASGQIVPSAETSQSTDRDSTDETPPPFKGFNAYENFRGMVNSSGSLLKLDSTVGYDFNRNFGVFTGVPLYFATDTTGNPSQTETHAFGSGDVYFGVEGYVPNRIANYTSSLTVSAPTGSFSKGFSPGKPTIDWSNRFRHHFGKLAPFVEGGLGNTVPDSELVTRSFTSLGPVAHFEEGAEFDLTKRVYIGGSAYQIVPFGNQQVFNRFDGFVPRDGNGGGGNGNGGNGNGGGNDNGNGNDHKGGPAPGQPPPGNTGQPSASGEDLTRENGFSAWVGFEPTRIVRLEFGYTRSATFQLNSFSFNLGFNVGRLFHMQPTH